MHVSEQGWGLAEQTVPGRPSRCPWQASPPLGGPEDRPALGGSTFHGQRPRPPVSLTTSPRPCVLGSGSLGWPGAHAWAAPSWTTGRLEHHPDHHAPSEGRRDICQWQRCTLRLRGLSSPISFVPLYCILLLAPRPGRRLTIFARIGYLGDEPIYQLIKSLRHDGAAEASMLKMSLASRSVR